MASLACPRCDVLLSTEHDESGEIEVHRCDRCHGAWVDGPVVGARYPALRHHRRRIGELLDKGARRGTGISRCPDGHHAVLEFPFFDLWLDLCETCHGLWVDGDEVRFVDRTAVEWQGLPEVERRGAAYRARERIVHERITCTSCEREVHPRRTFMTGDGAICDDCAEVGKMAASLDDDQPLVRLKRMPRAILRFVSRMLDASGKRAMRRGPIDTGL